MKTKLQIITILALLSGCAANPGSNSGPDQSEAAHKFVRFFTEKEYYNPYTGQTGRDSRVEEQIFGYRTP